MNWDGFQREVLAELGLRAYALAGQDAPVARSGERVEAGRVAAGQVEAGNVAIPPALLAALARAAGCAPTQVVAMAGIDAAPRDAASRRALWPRLRRLRTRTQ